MKAFIFMMFFSCQSNLFAKGNKANLPVAGEITLNAGNDTSLILPDNAVALNATASSTAGIITTYSWNKISGPSIYAISNSSISNPTISNLVEGTYAFEITVTDVAANTAKDTINISVSTRILIDFGPTTTVAPDVNGNYWNNIYAVNNGIKLRNAITTNNVQTNIGIHVYNRIDGSFGIQGPGVNTGNTIGDIQDYPSTATTDYAYADQTAVDAGWTIIGLDSTRTYTIKFWGTKSATYDNIIEIKKNDDVVWQSYNASGNTDYNNAAVFTVTGKSKVRFDIRVQTGSAFGYINLIDILQTGAIDADNAQPNAIAGNDVYLTTPSNSTSLDGNLSNDLDGFISSYNWTKISGPSQYTLSSTSASTASVSNLSDGYYQFELAVTDNEGAIDRDTVSVFVGSRILVDFGPDAVSSPDVNNNYWNIVSNANEGTQIADAINTVNENTGLSLKVINRIDGTFNLSGPGVNNGNTTGTVNDYPATVTADYAFADLSATDGMWKITGLDSTKTYSVKFWGTKSIYNSSRILEIKTSSDTTWKEYDASNNSDYNNAAYFIITGKTEESFNIKVNESSFFGYISLMDIYYTNVCAPTTSSTDVTACDSYTWNGSDYTSSGTYTYTTTNASGCDSTATLNLTINYSNISIESAVACDTYNWNGTEYTSSGIYTFTTTNSNGCDSIVILDLSINTSSTSTENAIACDVYNWNGNDYTTSGTYSFITTNANGCDSVITLNLTINSSTSSTEDVAACSTYNWNGNDYTSSGTYTFITTNANGCDSTAILNLTINTSTSSTEDVAACGIYSWNGTDYSASGTYTFTTTNINGCDSFAIINLTITEGILVYAGPDQTIEPGATAQLAGTISGTPISLSWTGGNGSYSPDNTSLNAIYTPSADEVAAGIVVLTLAADGGPCGTVLSSVTITISTNTPVTLLQFTGFKNGKKNQLQWSTATEINNAGFEIQRSYNGVDFTKIGYVASRANGGNSNSVFNYQFADQNFIGHIQYYRLVQLDNDNHSKLSNVVVIKDNNLIALSLDGVYPNPASAFINVVVNSATQQNSTIIIHDITGKLISKQFKVLNAGNNVINANTSRFAAGTYSVSVVTENNILVTSKFVKQ